MTFGEVLLWNQLKEDKFWGFDFDRQRCIDNYIVDFYCKELALIIEVDGFYHNHEEMVEKDDLREQTLKQFGLEMIRFSESEVKNDMSNVLRTIGATIVEILKSNTDIKLPKNFDRALLY